MGERVGWRRVLLVLAVLASIVAAFSLRRVPQSPAYHGLADRRTILGVPNALDVFSNLPFLVVGLAGLAALAGGGALAPSVRRPAPERRMWTALFLGIALTAPCSTYYHLAPDGDRLVWDRLPMALAFMALLSIVLADRVDARLARRLFPWLLLLGVGSVAHWAWTRHAGAGDLRLYGLVQYGSLLIVVLALALFPARAPGTAWLWAALACYALAKGFEAVDHQVFALGEVVSGHTLKHLAAGAGTACLLCLYLLRTRAVADGEDARGPRR